MVKQISKFGSYLMFILSILFGGGSLFIFLIFLFRGSLNLVNFSLGEIPILAFNSCISIFFFIQHSGMIRKSFRRWLEKFFRTEYHGAIYSIVSGVALLIVIIFWQKSSYTLIEPKGVWLVILRGIYFLSIAGFFWGTQNLGVFDPFGLDPILNRLRNKKPPQLMPLTIRGPFRYTRHPLYFFLLLMMWSCPALTADRLLFNLLWTIWIIIGIKSEERDLVSSFGQVYRDYQRKVPMLIPHSIRPIKLR